MRRTSWYFFAAAALVAFSTAGFAQTSPPSGEEPGAAPEAVQSSPAEGNALPSTPGFLTKRAQGQWLASDYIGSPVYDTAGEEVGEVDELVISEDGTVVALVFGVAGFLGVGDKDIAVPLAAVRLEDRDANPRVVTTYSKSELERAPAFSREPD